MAQDGSRISEIAPEDLTAKQKQVLEDVQKGRGFLPKPFLIWLHSPELAVRMEAIGTWLNTASSLTEREYEIAIVVVARRLNSPFVLGAHEHGMKRAGHPEAVLDAMRGGKTPEFATDRERVVYEIATHAYDDEPYSDELFDKAVSVLGREGLADLLALIGYYTGVGLAMKTHRVPPTPRG